MEPVVGIEPTTYGLRIQSSFRAISPIALNTRCPAGNSLPGSVLALLRSFTPRYTAKDPVGLWASLGGTWRNLEELIHRRMMFTYRLLAARFELGLDTKWCGPSE